jgi:AcrR family transcriptional regulator
MVIAMADSRGRPRSFDSEKALEQALGLFWQRGYLGTSYSDLCAETGLSKPSLYAAYGNKEETFLAALDLYVSCYVKPGVDILETEPNPAAAVRKLLVATVEGLTAEGTPPGCMIATNAACAAAPDVPPTVALALNAAAKTTPDALAARLTKARAARELPPDISISELTAFYDTLITGLSGLAKQGAPRETLMQAVDTAMLIWPQDAPD